MGKNIFDLSADMDALNDLLCDEDTNFDDPQVQQLLEQWSQETTGAFEGKVDNYCALVQTMEARAEIRRAEANRLFTRARSDARNAVRLKETLKYVFEQRGLRKLDTPRFRVGIQANGGKVPLKVDVPADKLPEQFRKMEYSPDNEAIRAALEAGMEIPGCALECRGEALRIK